MNILTYFFFYFFVYVLPEKYYNSYEKFIYKNPYNKIYFNETIGDFLFNTDMIYNNSFNYLNTSYLHKYFLYHSNIIFKLCEILNTNNINNPYADLYICDIIKYYNFFVNLENKSTDILINNINFINYIDSCIREPYKKKYMVFTSAGDNTKFYELWNSEIEKRNYDIYVIYYGDNDNNYSIYKRCVDYIEIKKNGSKFQNFYYLYNKLNKFFEYDRVFVLDDDIVFNVSDINEMFYISELYNLDISQPSFSNESKISHTITKHQPDKLLRFTNFIEVNTPLFSKKTLDNFMIYYDPILVGWGIDSLYMWVSGIYKKNKYAVIDKIKCINPKDDSKVGKRELLKLNSAHLRMKTWTDFQKKLAKQIGFKSWKLEEYGYIKL